VKGRQATGRRFQGIQLAVELGGFDVEWPL